MLKIKYILSIGYAMRILVEEDGFTLNTIQLSSTQKHMQDRVAVKKAMSFFKVQSVQLFYDLFFAKFNVTDNLDDLMRFLIVYEEYRFRVMSSETSLLSYESIFKMFVKESDIFTFFLERLSSASWFKQSLSDQTLIDNYTSVIFAIRKQSEKADKAIQSYESLYFFYFKYMLRCIECLIESKKIKDPNYRLEVSEEGKKLKVLIEEIANHKAIYKAYISEESVESIARFIRMYAPDFKDNFFMTVGDKDAENLLNTWDLNVQDRILTMLQIKVPSFSNNISRQRKATRAQTNKRKTVASKKSMIIGQESEDTDIKIEWDVANNYSIFYSTVEDSETTQKLITEEKLALALAFLNFDKQLDKDAILERGLADEKLLAKVNLKKDDLIRKMIKYIESQVGDKNAEANLKNLLEVFSLMIQESSEMEEMQDIFNDNKAMEMILVVLSSPRTLDTAFLKSLLVFANAMLQDKNIKVQKTICKHFKTFKQTERTLSRFNICISQITESLKDKNTKSVNLSMDDESRLICLEVLKLIVYCCEGHYREMQNYFRTQPNLSVQFNFLKETIDLIGALSSQITSSNYEILILCFDVLIEMTQGPNKENQDYIIKSSLLEVLGKFLSFSVTRDKRKRKVTGKIGTGELESWEIRKIKYKSVVLIMALIELADNPSNVFGRLSKFFSIYLILIYIEESFVSYSEIYGNELIVDSLNNVVYDNLVQRRSDTQTAVLAYRRRLQHVLYHERDHEMWILR